MTDPNLEFAKNALRSAVKRVASGKARDTKEQHDVLEIFRLSILRKYEDTMVERMAVLKKLNLSKNDLLFEAGFYSAVI